MSDVNCPYCGADLEINHDDGYGYDEDGLFQQTCDACDKVFSFTTSILYHYMIVTDYMAFGIILVTSLFCIALEKRMGRKNKQ